MDVQAYVNAASAKWAAERSKTQLTLGELIASLELMPAGSMVANLHSPGSYRGYYQDLYFKEQEGKRPAIELLADCRNCMGSTFEGYKGGDFLMSADTPLWVASYGACGLKLLEVQAGGGLKTAEETV